MYQHQIELKLPSEIDLVFWTNLRVVSPRRTSDFLRTSTNFCLLASILSYLDQPIAQKCVDQDVEISTSNPP